MGFMDLYKDGAKIVELLKTGVNLEQLEQQVKEAETRIPFINKQVSLLMVLVVLLLAGIFALILLKIVVVLWWLFIGAVVLEVVILIRANKLLDIRNDYQRSVEILAQIKSLREKVAAFKWPWET